MRKFIVALSLLLGCSQTEDAADPRRFGDPYEIMVNEAPALPDEPPALISDTLLVLVSYPGGCEDHDFDVDSEIDGDTARVWIHHDANGDACEAMIFDRIEARVPERVLEAPAIVLLNPSDDIPFILRWRPPAASD